MSELNISRTINGNGTIIDKYGMYELNVSGTNYYSISIQSNYELNNKLYNKNMGIESMPLVSLNSNVYNYITNLSTGIYYLRTAFSDLSNSGTISISIEPHTHTYIYSPSTSGHTATCTECEYTTTLSHVYDNHYCIHCGAYTSTHDYDTNYEWINYTSHTVECSCGEAERTEPHAVASGSYRPGQIYATCLLCGGLAEMGFVQWPINSSAITKVTINGSFILPNGVIVLEDEDFEAYLNGTLVFYDKDKVPVLQ